MKKIYLIFIFLLALTPCSRAQILSMEEDGSAMFPTNTGGSVVRNYNDDYAIGFFKGSGGGYFYAVQANVAMLPFTHGNRMYVSGTWEINDICFVGAELYFCGSDGTDALIGHFPVGNLLAGSGPVIIDCRKITTINTPRRLVAFSNGTSQHNVAVVCDSYVVNYDFSSTNGNKFDFTTPNGERIHDVLLYNGSIFYIGTDITEDCITIRRNTISHMDTMFNLWRYYPTTSGTHVISTGCLATLMTNDRLAVVHQTVNSDTIFELNQLTIQMPNMQCVDRHTYVNLHRAQYHDLKYIPATQRLELLYTDLVNYDTYVLEWQPMVINYYSANMLQPSLRYSSLDRWSIDYFLTISGYHWLLQNTQSTGWANSCETSLQVNVIPRPPHYMDNPGTIKPKSNPSISSFSVNTGVSTFSVGVGCMKKNQN